MLDILVYPPILTFIVGISFNFIHNIIRNHHASNIFDLQPSFLGNLTSGSLFKILATLYMTARKGQSTYLLRQNFGNILHLITWGTKGDKV